ncbi:MAG: cobalt-precorrin-5B (C(1))-methyltransferase [Austwickia sp.]|nr:MAG: cobalt-precorrin-5B (C(1))-methyltransferase [Austwickia sp.]
MSGGRAGQLSASGLRPGWTTGACAVAASRAAFVALRTGAFPDPVRVELPGGSPEFALTASEFRDGAAMVAVTKDAGDDPDVTHGAVVRAWLSPGAPGSGITYAAGPGVGTVTLPGLPLAVGEPAINPMPRRMIEDNLRAAAALDGLDVTDVLVRIGIDRGEDIARHTLNPRLGIIGGLSVLGTTGVVVPYSCSAWIDSIRRGVDVARAAGLRHVAGCTGSTSERVAREVHALPDLALLDMGDFVGAVLKYLRDRPVERLTICGGFAKLSKLADGHLDLHSGRSSVDVGYLARLAGLPAIGEATTALGALQVATAHGVPLGDLVAAAARDEALRVLGGAHVDVDVICIDRAGTIVGRA